MKHINKAHTPDDADTRRAVPPVICYPTDSLPTAGASILAAARQSLEKIDEVIVPPREARCFDVPAGHFFRIVSVEGSQVGDLNLWQADNLDERFYAGKTRACMAPICQPATGSGQVFHLCGPWHALPMTHLTGMAGTLTADLFMM